MQQIPLAAVPSQSLRIVLAGQNCTINVYQKSEGVFFDLSLDATRVVVAVLANDAGFLVCRQYEGFKGNLCFVDTQGKNDPDYTGLGGRYVLVYLTEAEYGAIV
jgi:hypothetical protein